MKDKYSTTSQVLAWGLGDRQKVSDIAKQLLRDKGALDIQWSAAKDIFEFLDENADKPHKNIVLSSALTRYSTEANYRFALARLMESGTPDASAILIEDATNPRVPLLYRAARALGIDWQVETMRFDGFITLKLNRAMGDFDQRRWAHDPAPFLDRPAESEVIDKIANSIVNREPLSLIRIGHCEVRFLGHNVLFGDSDINKSGQIQWGSPPPQSFLEKIKSDLAKSVKNADILGFKKRTSFSSRSLKVLDNSVLDCLSRLSLLQSRQIQTTPNIHFALGESLSFLEAIGNAKHIVLISPRILVQERLAAYCSTDARIDMLVLPGEARIDGTCDIELRMKRFVEIEQELSGKVKRGTVVLVGAGVAGKIYCEITRRLGGIGLDLGSTLDAWAGIESRGSGFPEGLKNALIRSIGSA